MGGRHTASRLRLRFFLIDYGSISLFRTNRARRGPPGAVRHTIDATATTSLLVLSQISQNSLTVWEEPEPEHEGAK
jgi:hypothetical protein